MKSLLEEVALSLPPTLGSVKERERIAEQVLAVVYRHVRREALTALPEVARVYRSAA